jgi:SPP1 family predicted phage head-tail adaptor
MALGQFNKRVTFKTYATSADGAGGVSEGSASTIMQTWARVTDKGSSRSLNEFVDTIQKRKQIDVLYRTALSDLDKNTFIEYNGVEYTIESNELIEEIKRVIRFDAVAAT